MVSMVGEPVGYTTVMALIFFGTNMLCFGMFWWMNRADGIKDVGESDDPHAKVLSKPFRGTLECCTALSKDLMLVGTIMAFTFVCERYPVFEHTIKHYDRDLFGFIVLIFFMYAWYTRAPTKDLTLLSRDQTEEWKGWMQFIFLLYHYFHAEEVYNR